MFRKFTEYMLSQARNYALIFPRSLKKAAYRTAAKSTFGFWYAGNVFDTSSIAYGIARNGVVEKNEVDALISILKQLPKPLMCIDVGAHTGYYSAVLAAVFPDSSIIAVEPGKEFVNEFKETINLNAFTNISIHEVALGNSPGTAVLHMAGSGSSISPWFKSEHAYEERKIPVTTADILLSQYTKISCIKIDAEGFEYEILQGAKQTILENQPVLYVEIAGSLKALQRNTHNPHFDDTFSFLSSLGYDAYVEKDAKLIKINNPSPWDGVRMCMFLHTDKHASLTI